MKKILLVSVSIIIISLGVFLTSTNMTASDKAGINSSEYLPKIPEVVEVSLLLSNGETRVINVKEKNIVALFWGNMKVPNQENESTAIDILGTFYDSLDEKIIMSKEHCLKKFGKNRTGYIFGSEKKEVKITKDFIRKLWNTPDEDGNPLLYIGKEDKCEPTGG